MKKFIRALLPLLLFALSYSLSYSYPRFSAYTGDKCIDCHVNPSGGGMRNTYGMMFAKKNLQADFLQKYIKKPDFSTQLNKNISVGGDVRIMHAGEEVSDEPSKSSFLTMQGDLYVNASLNDFVSVMVAPGIQIPNLPTKYEVYGMLHNLPLNGYFRAGRFTPNYGVRIVEHRAFQRADLLKTPYSADNGLEIGISPGVFSLSAGLFNGLNTNFNDNDPKRMFVSSADVMLTSPENNFNFNIGTSFYNNPYNFLDPVSSQFTDANLKAYSGFTKIGLFKRAAILGEVDFIENTRVGNMTRGFYGFGELSIILVKSVELRTQWEYRIPDRDASANRTIRTSVGAAFFPLMGFETEAMVRFLADDRNPNATELHWNFHFYF